MSVRHSSSHSAAQRTLYAIALVLACSAVSAADSPHYQLIDSRFTADDRYQPFWLDNEKLIFKGYEIGSYSRDMHVAPRAMARAKGYDAHGMHTGYYIWDTKTANVTLYKDKIANLCA